MGFSVTDYEHQRNARLSENRKRMEALGLLDLSRSLRESACNGIAGNSRKKMRRDRDAPTAAAAAPAVAPVAPLPARRSARLKGTALPSYKEVSVVKESEEVVDSRQQQPEIYTEEHEKLLGSCNEEWELFKDGYSEDGTRIYDPVNGKTCHQCRQKTIGLRTWCNKCKALRGQFCGDCLFMRYGENVIEVQKNKDWVCPSCRGICNCSFCRIKKGWAPTGSMYRLALQMNYKSVAHYLIMTRRVSQAEKVVERKTDSQIVVREEKAEVHEDNQPTEKTEELIVNKSTSDKLGLSDVDIDEIMEKTKPVVEDIDEVQKTIRGRVDMANLIEGTLTLEVVIDIEECKVAAKKTRKRGRPVVEDPSRPMGVVRRSLIYA